jgi:hypothetical protein
LRSIENLCDCSMISELSPVGVVDVKNWFRSYGHDIYENEPHKREEIIKSIFQNQEKVRMNVIERKLNDILEDHCKRRK